MKKPANDLNMLDSLWEINVYTPWMITAKYSERLTLDQSQLIKEAVNQTISYVMGKTDMLDELNAARTAIKDGE